MSANPGGRSPPATPGADDDPETWRHETAHLDGVSLHYVRVDPEPGAAAGATEPPLAVCLHGFPEFWYAWRHQLSPLADAGFRVVAPDMRGYNRSSKPEGVASYRLENLVADVRGLVESLGYARTHLVGHDWGGLVAWETAIREPDLLDRLVVLNAPHPERYRRTLRQSPRQVLRSSYAVAAQVPWLPERLLRANDLAAVERLLADTARPDAFSEAEIERYKRAMATEGTMTAALNYYRAQFRGGVGRELRSLVGRERDTTVRVPTMVVWGEQDRALGTELLDGLGAFVPDLRVERLPAASHWVQADAPDRVTDLLLDFLG
ncbi:MAG: pimeloyl-ACP methyl ester carboxylesterase [Natronomonas sp.]|jgi:pimeloyl-ACP methyl ester carboxylesterase